MPTACEVPLSFNVKLLGKKLFDCKSDLKFDCKSELKFDCKSEFKFDCKSELKLDCKSELNLTVNLSLNLTVNLRLNLTVNLIDKKKEKHFSILTHCKSTSYGRPPLGARLRPFDMGFIHER